MRANSARATPQKDQELIRTLDISLLARKNSFWSFAIRQRLSDLKLGYTYFDMNNAFEICVQLPAYLSNFLRKNPNGFAKTIFKLSIIFGMPIKHPQMLKIMILCVFSTCLNVSPSIISLSK